ncbi:hypothetical protein CDAR_563791 [Caerostris darwini]|uniref:Uncharacterized protein n=1 Tax=Caerostris darwini TaxID=1538125 RepID=A0AAV4UZ76_9ARAC|nr:hypothetical protein CDAR_563791 [Caerostris darwini]
MRQVENFDFQVMAKEVQVSPQDIYRSEKISPQLPSQRCVNGVDIAAMERRLQLPERNTIPFIRNHFKAQHEIYCVCQTVMNLYES